MASHPAVCPLLVICFFICVRFHCAAALHPHAPALAPYTSAAPTVMPCCICSRCHAIKQRAAQAGFGSEHRQGLVLVTSSRNEVMSALYHTCRCSCSCSTCACLKARARANSFSANFTAERLLVEVSSIFGSARGISVTHAILYNTCDHVQHMTQHMACMHAAMRPAPARPRGSARCSPSNQRSAPPQTPVSQPQKCVGCRRKHRWRCLCSS